MKEHEKEVKLVYPKNWVIKGPTTIHVPADTVVPRVPKPTSSSNVGAFCVQCDLPLYGTTKPILDFEFATEKYGVVEHGYATGTLESCPRCGQSQLLYVVRWKLHEFPHLDDGAWRRVYPEIARREEEADGDSEEDADDQHYSDNHL